MNGLATTWVTQVQSSFPLHSFLLFIAGFGFIVFIAILPTIVYYLVKNRNE